MFAIATMLLNRSISGSFVNCGAPPDSEMTVATRIAPRAAVAPLDANAASQSRGPGGMPGSTMAWKTASPTIAQIQTWAML